MLRNLYFLALLATIACDGKPVQTTQRAATLVDSAEQVMFNGKTTITANGVRRGEIAGDTIASFDQLTRFTVLKMRVQFVTPLGRPLAQMSTAVGRYSLRTGAITTQRGTSVLIQSDTAGRRMFAKDVTYDAVKNQIASNGEFILTSGKRKTTGTGFTADPGLFVVKCKSQCQGPLP